ncbi:ApeA N-terminal domain 1-containing protein [Yersinia enterocolitica]|uniref:ApeA N-terminal domain 1-containing protein n=1 Tax=Yersinia enterocolitica TaxID=630 RepID=UPI00398C9B0A
MAAIKYEFTKKHSFHGEFWQDQNDNKGRFSARIEYSSYDGLILDYCISDSDSPTTCERLYGVLNTGQLCTLIGPFDFSQGKMHIGIARVFTGRHSFSIIIFDGFYEESLKIEHCYLSLHGLQEFIYPQGYISQLKHSLEPISSTEGDSWKLEIVNAADFSIVGNNLMNIIDCRNNKNALEELSESFNVVKQKHPDALFMIRQNLIFYFKYIKTDEDTVDSYISSIWDISGLLSILINKPIIPDELYFKFENKKNQAPCLFSNNLEQRTLDLALKKITHQTLPLNWKQIDIGKVFAKWFVIAKNYAPLTVTYQNETGYRNLHQAHADIILFSTQLEAINVTLGGKSHEKYMKPIDEYASPLLKKSLKQIFENINNESLGANIATLRNELAHVDREKVLMKTLKLSDYIKIGIYLKAIIASHLLTTLDVDKSQIIRYQDKVTQ